MKNILLTYNRAFRKIDTYVIVLQIYAYGCNITTLVVLRGIKEIMGVVYFFWILLFEKIFLLRKPTELHHALLDIYETYPMKVI